MKTPTPLLLIIALCIGLSIGMLIEGARSRPAFAAPPLAPPGRYQLQPVGGGLFVLDTQTGEVRGFFPAAMHGTWANNYAELGRH